MFFLWCTIMTTLILAFAKGDDIQITPLTPPPKGDKVIKIGVILPKDGKYHWSAHKAIPGIMYAVETVQNSTHYLENFEVTVNYGDSKCSDTYGPLAAIKMSSEDLANVFLGPACDYSVAPVARFSPHWNIPLLTGGALVHAFQDKRQYAQLTRISGSYAKLGEFFTILFKAFNWVIPGLIYHDNRVDRNQGKTDCFFIMEAVFLALQKPFREKYPKEEIWRKPFDENYPDMYNTTTILQEASTGSRSKIYVIQIIFNCVDGTALNRMIPGLIYQIGKGKRH